MLYKIHLDSNNWSPFEKCIVQYSLAVAQGGTEHSAGFVQVKPSIVKFLVILDKVKDTIGIDINKRNLHLHYFIIITLL